MVFAIASAYRLIEPNLSFKKKTIDNIAMDVEWFNADYPCKNIACLHSLRPLFNRNRVKPMVPECRKTRLFLCRNLCFPRFVGRTSVKVFYTLIHPLHKTTYMLTLHIVPADPVSIKIQLRPRKVTVTFINDNYGNNLLFRTIYLFLSFFH